MGSGSSLFLLSVICLPWKHVPAYSAVIGLALKVCTWSARMFPHGHVLLHIVSSVGKAASCLPQGQAVSTCCRWAVTAHSNAASGALDGDSSEKHLLLELPDCAVLLLHEGLLLLSSVTRLA